MSKEISRRRFTALSLATVGAGGLAAGAAMGSGPTPLLPTVRWKDHEITRLLVGHNPIKGISHLTPQLNQEMRAWFGDQGQRAVQLLAECQSAGINACQMGFQPGQPLIEELLQSHYEQGGRLKWIATFYSMPQDREEGKQELARILRMNPPPIGVQQVGNTSDLLMRQGKIDSTPENLKLFRDAGLLVGLGSHNHEVIDYAENAGWDLDFYQCCFYRSLFGLDSAAGGGETFEEEARQSMTRTICRVSKPCIAFKVLAAGRHCGSPSDVDAAMRDAYENIKPTDVVLVGMWQKYKNQAGENAALVRKILAGA
jgi:hypothetical protein